MNASSNAGFMTQDADYSSLKICLKCGMLFGMWEYFDEDLYNEEMKKREELDAEDILSDFLDAHQLAKVVHYQGCSCQAKDNKESGGKTWQGFDFNEKFALCMCCGQEIILSGSKFSSFYCKKCGELIRIYNHESGRTVVPLGRHSLMNGVGLSGKVDEHAIGNFMIETQNMASDIDLVYKWRVLVINENISKMRLPHDCSIPVKSYLERLYRDIYKDPAGYDKKQILDRLVKFMSDSKRHVFEPGKAVPVIYFSLLIKSGPIEEKYPGGMRGFLDYCEKKNTAWCRNEDLVRISAMGMQDIMPLADNLIENGLQCEEKPVDFYIVDAEIGHFEDPFKQPREKGMIKDGDEYSLTYLTVDDGKLETVYEGGKKVVKMRIKQECSEQ